MRIQTLILTLFFGIAFGIALPIALPKLASAETIREIVVADNSKTTDDTVIYIANIEPGDDWSEDVRAATLVELQSSGLFKTVDVFSEPHPKGGVKITIMAKDKHSWVIAPAVYNQPTNKGAGVGFGENNLFGENKKLFLYGQIATGDSFLIAAYIDPSISGSVFHWAFDLFQQNQRVIEYATPSKFLSSPKMLRQTKLRYLNAGGRLGVTLFRSLSLDARLRGAYVFYGKPSLREGATLEEVTGDPADTELKDPGASGFDITASVSLTFDRRANWQGVVTGDRYNVSYEKALPQMGSDFDYWLAKVSYARARKYFERHNLVLKTGVAMGHDLPFQSELTSGGTTLRGYKGAQFRGDFQAGANVEYSVHLFSMPFPLLEKLAVRGQVFYDSRYTTFLDIDETDTFRNYLPGAGESNGLSPFKNSVGIGTRFFAHSIVLPLLGLDVGYGLESGAVEVFFAIGLTDV